VGLADAAGPDEDDVGLFGDKVERGGLVDQDSVDLFWVVEVVCVEGGERKDGGALECGGHASLGLETQLLAHEVVEQRGGRIVSGDGFLSCGIEQRGRVVQPDGAHGVGEREQIRRGHRSLRGRGARRSSRRLRGYRW
jgi:hypothetical protein